MSNQLLLHFRITSEKKAISAQGNGMITGSIAEMYCTEIWNMATCLATEIESRLHRNRKLFKPDIISEGKRH